VNHLFQGRGLEEVEEKIKRFWLEVKKKRRKEEEKDEDDRESLLSS